MNDDQHPSAHVVTHGRIFRRAKSVDRNQGLGALRWITSIALRYPGRIAAASSAAIVAALA